MIITDNFVIFGQIAKQNLVYRMAMNVCCSGSLTTRLRGDYTLLLSNFVLDITFKQIH